MPRRRTWILLIVALLAGTTVLGLWQPWKTADTGPRYRLAKLERGPLSAAVNASGTLSALVTVQVGSQVSGQIKDIRVDFNSEVKRDQIIARLDPETFESRVTQSQADLQSAESAAEVARGNLALRQVEVSKAAIALADAERNLARKRALVQQGFISAAELDTAQAQTTTCVLTISGDDFQTILLRYPHVALAALRITAARLKDAQDMIQQLSAHSAEQRIAAMLLKLSEKVGEPQKDGVLIQMPLSRQDLADLTGTTPETASRVMSQFRQAKLIRTGRQWVSILDRQRLLDILSCP